jgi:hypothetical protein
LDLIERIRSEESRHAFFTPSFNHLRSFGTSVKNIIEPPSSDEGSDDLCSYPSISKVSERIIDTSCLNLSDVHLNTPHKACVLIAPVQIELKSYKLLNMLTDKNIKVQEVQIIDYNIQFPRAALLWFDSHDTADQSYNQIINYGFLIEEIALKIVKWVEYPALFPNFPFYALVLRGFNRRMSLKDIKDLFAVPIKRCEIRIINACSCALVVMDNILNLCIACKAVHLSKDSSGNVIKCHIHPLTQHKHSKAIIETLMSDLPTIKSVQTKDNVDVFKVLNLGMNKNKNAINPLENLIRNSNV